jgi:hypothetical protein
MTGCDALKALAVLIVFAALVLPILLRIAMWGLPPSVQRDYPYLPLAYFLARGLTRVLSRPRVWIEDGRARHQARPHACHKREREARQVVRALCWTTVTSEGEHEAEGRDCDAQHGQSKYGIRMFPVLNSPKHDAHHGRCQSHKRPQSCNVVPVCEVTEAVEEPFHGAHHHVISRIGECYRTRGSDPDEVRLRVPRVGGIGVRRSVPADDDWWRRVVAFFGFGSDL